MFCISMLLSGNHDIDKIVLKVTKKLSIFGFVYQLVRVVLEMRI